MALTKHKVENKRSFGLFAVIVIAAMFLIRYILLETGTIDEMYTLEEDELCSALAAYEVAISCLSPDAETENAGGTILDGRKISTGDENYTLTIVTSYAAVVSAASASDSGEGTTVITVTLPDGTESEGAVIAWNESGGYALIQCLYPEELEVYYSRDILYRLSEEEPVYILWNDEVLSGSAPQTDVDADGIGKDLIAASLDDAQTGSGIAAGSGFYGKSGNYLGMVLDVTEDGTVYAVPGDVIMAALNAAL